MHGIDYSWARPGAPLLASAGVKYAFRYVAHDVGKALTGAEAAALIRAGIAVAPNFEDTATNALKGAAQGRLDADFANDELDRMGCPPDVLVWYSVDTAAMLAQVGPYFQGIKAAQRRPAGFYGGLQVGKALRDAGFVVGVWCANAASWSGHGTWEAMARDARAANGADVLQHLDHPLVSLDPLSYDYDEVLRPFPAWGATAAPPIPKDAPMAIHPRRAKATASWPLPAIVPTPNGLGAHAYHGALFATSAGFAVSKAGASAALVAPHNEPVTVAESVKGDGLIFTDTDGDEFFLRYAGPLQPDPWTEVSSVPPAPPDIDELARAVAAHLKIAAQ